MEHILDKVLKGELLELLEMQDWQRMHIDVLQEAYDALQEKIKTSTGYERAKAKKEALELANAIGSQKRLLTTVVGDHAAQIEHYNLLEEDMQANADALLEKARKRLTIKPNPALQSLVVQYHKAEGYAKANLYENIKKALA